MSAPPLEIVAAYRHAINPSLDSLPSSPPSGAIEPATTESDCGDLVLQIQHLQEQGDMGDGQQAQYAAIETVFRERFYELLASTQIEDPAFTQMWNLLDVVSILSDKSLCESGLIFWLIEELLDSQPIDGCRRVFDYLESRQERITSKHFKQKNLIILRCCNELLRRLSRAEDIVFCGRVFIFLFQSFPLGDKSSVNLRGEYHVENTTNYDAVTAKSEDATRPMEIDAGADGARPNAEAGTPAASNDTSGVQTPIRPSMPPSSSTVEEGKPDLDLLYPLFWSLQSYFSAPTKLFDRANLTSFKEGISATMSCFQTMTAHTAVGSRQGDTKRGTKRKRTEAGNEVSSTFNPKYLTNRDLFDLEVHDIAFRRHILVQVLIVLDFLLSLTSGAKAKMTDLTNKSVLYGYPLSNEDAEWASSTKETIAKYLQLGNNNEGKFYYRMVDTVLSRDKNWVRWKAENCPPIDRPSVDVQQYLEAQRSIEKICRKQDLVPPPGAGDLKFLSETTSMESLKDPSRYSVPSMESFYKGIQTDELDAEFGTEEDMQTARNAKERKLWRALRASKNRFTLCEKIQNGKNVKALIGEIDEVENVPPNEEKDSEAKVNEETEVNQETDDGRPSVTQEG